MIEIVPNWHPIFVHFTLALWMVAALFFMLAISLKRSRLRSHWLQVAGWNMWLGAGFALATALAGWSAYNSVAHDAASHVAMTAHRDWAVATLIVMLPLSAWSAWHYYRARVPGLGFLILLVFGVGLLATTGWRGAELVYRYGLGVMSLPAGEGGGRGHLHADGEAHDHGRPDEHHHAH